MKEYLEISPAVKSALMAGEPVDADLSPYRLSSAVNQSPSIRKGGGIQSPD